MPIEYDLIDYQHFASVYQVEKDGKMGLYSSCSECLAPCQYDADCRLFFCRDGYSTVQKDRKQGLINSKGQEVIPCMYDLCFYDAAFGKVRVKVGEEWSILDLQNKPLVPDGFKVKNISIYDEGLLMVEKDGKLGLYDTYGNCTL